MATTGSVSMVVDEARQITEDEAKLYDRQIRLWGVEAQNRMRNSHVLIVGMRALSTEVCKNLVLAGIGIITILDDEKVVPEDLGAQFFLVEGDVGKSRAEAVSKKIKELNPRVKVIIDSEGVTTKTDDYFLQFQLVCVTDADLYTLKRIDSFCHTNNVPFYAANTFGFFGYIFCDLNHHIFIEEKKSKQGDKFVEPETTREQKTEDYVSLKQSLERTWGDVSAKKLKRISPLLFGIQLLWHFQQINKRPPNSSDIPVLLHLRDEYLKSIGIQDLSILDNEFVETLATQMATELTPVAAIVGGILAQDILKVLQGKDLPVQNWFLYNGLDGSGLVHQVEPGKLI